MQFTESIFAARFNEISVGHIKREQKGDHHQPGCERQHQIPIVKDDDVAEYDMIDRVPRNSGALHRTVNRMGTEISAREEQAVSTITASTSSRCPNRQQRRTDW